MLDFATATVSGSQLDVKGTTVAQTLGNSATSVINIIAVEDLGGGMKATAKYGLDPRALANDAGALGRDELFVGIEGGFGNLRLGSPNSIGLTTYLSAAPLGTGIGSGYGAIVADYANIRYSRSARYDSPSFNGFSVSVLYAPGNDVTATTGAPTTQLIANARQVTELGLAYANGPLTVSYANVSQAKQTNTAAAKTSTNILAASYKMGNTTLTAGWNDGDALASSVTTAAQKSEGYRFGVRQDIGAVALIASYAEQKTNLIKETVTGLRADYNLSKTAALYLGYEDWDNSKATASATVNKGTRKVTSVGLRKAF